MKGNESHSQQKEKKVVSLKAVDATPSNFEEFGQVVSSSPDGALFGPSDAQLQLHRGTPRFYIMRLEKRDLRFGTITHHANVTQCLGSVGGHPWYLGVARPSILKAEQLEGYKLNQNDIQELSQDYGDVKNINESITESKNGKVLLSKAGHYYVPPAPEDVKVFRVHGPQFLKLHVGTWHAGPLFKEASMDFYNLELSDTNVSPVSLDPLCFAFLNFGISMKKFCPLLPWSVLGSIHARFTAA